MRQLHELMTEKCISIRDSLDRARRMARSGETGPQLVALLDNAWGMATTAARFYGPTYDGDDEAPAPLTRKGVVAALSPPALCALPPGCLDLPGVPDEASEAIDAIITTSEACS